MRKRDVFPAIFLLIAALLAAVLCGIKLAMGDTVYAATQAVIALFLTATALLLLRNAALLAVLRERGREHTALSEAWNAVTKANADVALRAAESTAKAAAAAELYTDAIKDQIKARETLAQTNRRLAELN